MLDTLLALADLLLFGAMLLALILGLSCIVMAFLSSKNGAEALKERIEYGFLGVSDVGIITSFSVLGVFMLVLYSIAHYLISKGTGLRS